MQKCARAVAWLDELVSDATLWLCGALLTVMVITTALGVIFRYVLHSSLSWSDEFGAYLFVWLTCLGAAVALKRRAHPEVRILADRVPSRVQPLLHAITDCAVMALGLVFVFYGGRMIELMGTETAASIQISMVYPFLAIPVSGGLIVFHSITHLLLLFLNALTPRQAGVVGAMQQQL
jgi:TRAP-type C4-dicarboxylate transport system permease small subunit